MADEIDLASELEQRQRDISLSLISNAREVDAMGYCLECATQVEGDLRWCSADCRDQFQTRNKRLKAQGRL